MGKCPFEINLIKKHKNASTHLEKVLRVRRAQANHAIWHANYAGRAGKLVRHRIVEAFPCKLIQAQ